MKRMSMILKSARMARSALLVAAFALALPALGHAEDAPKGNKDFKATVLQTVDLGSEIAGMEDHQLRLRLLTIAPGGHIGLHSHKDRPAVVYFLQGTDTVFSADGKMKTFKPGDSSSANHDTTHWHRNDGKEPVILLNIDILHKSK